jgi:hypothetical protein
MPSLLVFRERKPNGAFGAVKNKLEQESLNGITILFEKKKIVKK